MYFENILFIASIGMFLLAIGIVNFRITFNTWILLAGALGIPLLTVRKSPLMLSELLLAPLILIWIMGKILGKGFIKQEGSSNPRVNTEIIKSLWAMIAAFSLSFIFSLILEDPSVGGRHVFIMGKAMALFLYVASVVAALITADMIRSFDDVRRICFLLITLGIFIFIGESFQNTSLFGFLKVFQKGVGWEWMNVTILFAFSLAYLVFSPQVIKKLKYSFIPLGLAFSVLSAYFLGTATYKAIIISYVSIIFTIFYYKSKKMALLFFGISIIIFVLSFSIFIYYVDEETKEGSWGEGASSRSAIWEHSFLIFMERPIFGVGPYNYYDYSLYVSAKRKNLPENWGVMTTPHGQYPQILAETGVIGTLAFLWFMIELLRLLKYFLTPNVDFRINIIASAISAVLISRLVIGLLGDYVIPQYHNGGLQNFCTTVYFWVCLGVLIGLRRITQTERFKNLKPHEIFDFTPSISPDAVPYRQL